MDHKLLRHRVELLDEVSNGLHSPVVVGQLVESQN
jgi:hypothetical protein